VFVLLRCLFIFEGLVFLRLVSESVVSALLSTFNF
jgi:hypothetical protein